MPASVIGAFSASSWGHRGPWLLECAGKVASGEGAHDVAKAPQAMKNAVPSGIEGLDDILHGGWPAERMYLVIGQPGTGKTTLGLQFLLDGCRRGESVLYISLSETWDEVVHVARSHGWDLTGVAAYELTAAEKALGLADQQTMFDPSEVEFRETTRSILERIQSLRPRRVVFDSLSELALLAREPLAFRREILLLKRALIDHGATVLFLSDSTTPEADLQLQSLAHGVVVLEELAPEYGPERRRLRVRKLRGTKFRGGYHDFRIETGGVHVFPRLVASEHGEPISGEPLRSGLEALDALTGGGLRPGSSTLILGPAGSGKSSIASQYALGALRAGDRAAIFSFDESTDMLLRRTSGVGQPLAEHLASGALLVRQVDPAEMTPGEFVHAVRQAVEQHGAHYVSIDSLNGYIYAMPQERFLHLHVHELLSYLSQKGVVTTLLLAQHGVVGTMNTPVDVTYVADAVMVLRVFEARGRMRRAVSMLKKRDGMHESTIRELEIRPGALHIGEALDDFQGVFTGVPSISGSHDALPGAR